MANLTRSLPLFITRARFGRASPVLVPVAVGLAAMLALAGVYLGIVSLAESPGHALDLFWDDRRLVVPILLSFGAQVGLYAYVRAGAHLPAGAVGASATGGGLSTVAMIACCAHHVTDLLPIVGVSLAATFLTAWKTQLMALGLAANLAGIALMLWIIRRDRRRAVGRP